MGLLEYRDFGISGEDDDICIDLTEGMWQPYQVRGQDWVVPKLEGKIWGNRRRDSMILPLAGFIRGSGGTATERLEDFNTNVLAVMAVMDTEAQPGTLKASTGYLGLSSGAEATIECRVRNAAPGRIQSYGNYPFQLWTFELEALEDPVEWVISGS
jgi:hypothetical protein